MLTLEPLRDTIFIGHANPEDNEFTEWLGLQLASHGYKVWTDILKLLGGEDFWKDIETVIRTIAVKHLYVLTRASNSKQGCLDELAVSRAVRSKESLGDFIIPLHLDSIPYEEMNIGVARLNAIDFTGSWATGLAKLLKKLEDDHVPHSTNTPATVAAYWRHHHGSSSGVREETEPHLTNFFPVSTPPTVHIHTLRKGGTVDVDQLRWPAVKHEHSIISFAGAIDLQIDTVSTRGVTFEDYENRRTGDFDVHPMQARRHLTDLLRRTWEAHLLTRGLRTYKLANHTVAAFHESDRAGGKSIPYRGTNGKETHRGVVGYKTMQSGHRRYYHVAISAHAKLDPVGYRILTHVLFSDDGKTIWHNAKAMHRARRSQCWDWWNDDWRDRLLASVQYLGDLMALNSSDSLAFMTSPSVVHAPVTYDDPPKRTATTVDDDVEDEDEDGE
jgi:hypothetical protein